jgi:hypothetical protein
MNNEFTKETRSLFDMGGYCKDWEDERNDSDSLHHILGRCSNSPYNAAPLNNVRNHQPEGRKNLGSIHSFEVRRKYLIKTKKYLDSIGYKPKPKDLEFLNTYKEYYVYST